MFRRRETWRLYLDMEHISGQVPQADANNITLLFLAKLPRLIHDILHSTSFHVKNDINILIIIRYEHK
jgi:hypothetical protein